MLISEKLAKRSLSILEITEQISKPNSTVIGKLIKIFPQEIVNLIIDMVDLRFTNYYDGYGSNYYKYKINALLSWSKWRKKNSFPVYNPCDLEIKKLKEYGRKELKNEILSMLIYGI